MAKNQPTFRFWSRYSREYLYEPRKFAPIVSFVYAFVIGLLFLGGIRPTWLEIKEAQKELASRKELLASMNRYTTRINELKPIYEKTPMSQEILHKLITDGPGIPDLLEMITLSAAKQGYSIASFTPQQATTTAGDVGESLELDVEFKGDLSKASELVTTIETMDRFAAVEGATMFKAEGQGRVKLRLKVFFLE